MAAQGGSSAGTKFWVYVGNYGKAEPKGIFLMRFDAGTGELAAAGLAAEAREPNFVITHPNGRFVYAVTSEKVADYSGAVEAYAVEAASGRLTFLNRQASGGSNPAHLAIDPSGRVVIVGNYSGGTVAAFPLDADGRIGEATAVVKHQGSSVHPKRQRSPNPHGITFDRTGRRILVPDLGADRIFTYEVDAGRGTLTAGEAAALPPGSGPRHVAFGREDRFVYVLNELTCTLTVFSYGEKGAMREVETIAVWAEKAGMSGAEIEMHPSGRFLYASNRGHDDIAICAIDAGTGKLKLLEMVPTGGKTPRHFGLDPTGKFLLASNQDSDSIVVFTVDGETGRLARTAHQASAGSPCCVAFIREG